MDPVYAGTIAGLTILFFCVIACLSVYGYLEWRTSQQETEYQRVEALA